MFLTAQLVFTIFMLAAEKHRATFIAPIGIGLSLFIAELMGVYYTGGSLNPARSFGPCVVLRSFNSYHWIYWVGPILGAMVASGFYMFIKALEYETVNPEQDGEGNDGRVFDPNSGLEKKIIPACPAGCRYDMHHSRKNGRLSPASAGVTSGETRYGRDSDETAVAARGLVHDPAVARKGREPDLEAGEVSPIR